MHTIEVGDIISSMGELSEQQLTVANAYEYWNSTAQKPETVGYYDSTVESLVHIFPSAKRFKTAEGVQA